MPSLTDQLAAIKQRIADANHRVERQFGLIETLAEDGHDTQSALDLLATLEESRRELQTCQDDIEDRIGREISN